MEEQARAQQIDLLSPRSPRHFLPFHALALHLVHALAPIGAQRGAVTERRRPRDGDSPGAKMARLQPVLPRKGHNLVTAFRRQLGLSNMLPLPSTLQMINRPGILAKDVAQG